MKLEGRTAIVTGGSRGIGRAICIKLASEGANVVTCYHSKAAEAETVVAECEKFGVKALALQADMNSEEDVEKLFTEAEAITGKIDILVNNAGVTADNLIIRMKDEEFEEVINTNLRGVFYCLRAAAKRMMRKRYGRIVNISSIVGVTGNAGQVNYAAAKAGVIGMTKSMAKELGSRGVTCNAVAPGFINTDMTAVLPETAKEALVKNIALGRAGEPEDIANAVAFLASDDASYVTGQVLEVTGGMQ